jgi:hypothetical protein
VADCGQRLRETLEQRYIGAHQKNRCHVVVSSGVPRARRGRRSLLFIDARR